MPDLESIEALQRCLVVYRRTLEFLEVQRAQFGAFTPPYIWHQFDETRSEIARVKHELRDQGIEVDDRPGDTALPGGAPAAPAAGSDSATLLLAYQRMLLDQVRYAAPVGKSDWRDQQRQLADVYVDRTLTPLAVPSGASSAPVSLFERAGAPGARLLIEGAPGSGKTTCLHALALASAARALGTSGAEAALAERWPAPALLPIMLSGRDIALALTRGNAAPNDQSMPTRSEFWGAIEGWLQYSNLQDLVPTIQQMLERGECLVLIDDMDALPPGASEHAFMSALGHFVARYADNRFVVTYNAFRPGALAPLASFARHALAPLDQAQASALIQRWYAGAADRAGLLIAEDVAGRVAQLEALVLGDERLAQIARTPLALALCVQVHAEGYALPAERGLILERLADLLLSGQRPDRHELARQLGQVPGLDQLATPGQRLALIEPLALALQSQVVAGAERPPTLAAAEIEKLLGAGLFERCCEQALLCQVAPGAYTMPNTQLREYLAGRALAGLPDFPNRAYGRRDGAHWYETILHAMHELDRRGAPHVARLFIRLLLHPRAGDAPTSLAEALLAGACLLEMRERSWTDRMLRAEVRERLLACIAQPGLAVPGRIRAGLLLGQLGDPRHECLLPPLATVAAGMFVLGTPAGYDDEAPMQPMPMPEFAIGIFPVTNREYARFLAENRGHAPPHHWHDPRYNNPACPVVGVTWHDAAAYCAWLTARLHAAGLLPPEQVVRLPLEQEWEKAASWDAAAQAKRQFPWGDDWSSERANTAEGRGFWMTSPVGSYPDGASPYGLHDCVGNVWEWTASEYASYPGAARPFHEAGAYTLRGSSHATNPTHARCTFRSRLPPSSWRSHLGFRVVVGPPLPPATALSPGAHT